MANFENVNKVDVITPRHSYQDLSHTMKYSCDFGQLIPTSCFLLAPNEKIRIKSDFFARMAPMISPLMDGIDIYNYVFACPIRLIYADFNSFLTGGRFGDLASDYVMPLGNINLASDKYTNRAGVTYNNVGYKDLFCAGSLADYLGFPTPITVSDFSNLKDITVDEWPFRVYHKIWNDYFRNQNVEDEEYEYTDGNLAHDIPPQYMQLRYKNFNKDYFTSALPFTQRGPAVEIPFEADVVYKSNEFHPSKIVFPTGTAWHENQTNMDEKQYKIPDLQGNSDVRDQLIGLTDVTTSENSLMGAAGAINNADSLAIGNISATINNLRYAIALQQFQELNARAGSRYIEFVMAHYGATPQDARLQRAEYLGGSKTPIQVSAVVQQSQTTIDSDDNVSALGQLGGYGISTGSYDGIEFYTSEEFTAIMVISCVMPHNSYLQGYPKHFKIRDRFDLPIPMFAGLGDQPIEQEEVYFDMWSDNRDANNAKVFGYTSRYNQFRFLPDRIAGDFRTSLNTFHLARYFNSLNPPQLNSEFIKVDPADYNRIFNVTDNDVNHFWIEVYHNIDSWRVIPRLGVPVMSVNATDNSNSNI